MKKIFWIFIFMFSLANCYEMKTILGFKNPKGIFANENVVFVSNIGEKTNFLIKDKGGFISKLSKNGDMIEEKFIIGLDRPTELTQIENTLFVLDIDKIKAFDARTGEQIFELFINSRSDLNGIKKLNENALLVGDLRNSILYKIDLQTRTYEEFLKLNTNKFGNLRDFALDFTNNKLYILGHDEENTNTIISIYDLNNKNIKIFKEEKNNYNAMILYENMALLNALDENLDGKIYRLNLNNKKSEALKLNNIQTPSGMFLDNEILWLTILTQAKVLRIIFKN